MDAKRVEMLMALKDLRLQVFGLKARILALGKLNVPPGCYDEGNLCGYCELSICHFIKCKKNFIEFILK